MLLRSSSTPVLGSLLHSFAESPNNSNNNIHHETAHSTIRHHYPPPTTALHQNHNKFSLNQSSGSIHLSCNSSPISPSFLELPHSGEGIRRAQSTGNLEGLAYPPCSSGNEENSSRNPPTKLPGKPKCMVLETIPSVTFNNSRFRSEDVGFDEEINGNMIKREEEEKMMAVNGREFGLANKENMVLSEEIEVVNKGLKLGFEQKTGLVSQGLFLARGLGIDSGIGSRNGGGGGGGGGGGDLFSAGSGGDGGNNQSLEEYYRRMVEENPGNPLFLRNYAQFLYKSKQDLEGAAEYYSRAILLDPNDGEILSQYAQLVWKLNHDLDRASIYFERAIQASPEDSHVHAAYASFLWETEEEDNECNVESAHNYLSAQVHQGPVASAHA